MSATVHRGSRGRVCALHSGVTANLLRRFICEHLVRFFQPAARRWRVRASFAVTIRLTGKSCLLTASLNGYAHLLLPLFAASPGCQSVPPCKSAKDVRRGRRRFRWSRLQLVL